MALYIDLKHLFSDDLLKNRVDVAVIIAASDLLAGNPTVEEQRWAASVFNSPRTEGQKAFMAVLAANKSATVAQIQNAGDAALQTNVDAVVSALVVAHSAVGII